MRVCVVEEAEALLSAEMEWMSGPTLWTLVFEIALGIFALNSRSVEVEAVSTRDVPGHIRG